MASEDLSKIERKFSYNENEKVLCFHGPLIYEAKIIEKNWLNDPEATGPHYYIHYTGWKSSWDEWVAESRVLRYSEENKQMQKRLKALYRISQNGKSTKGLTESDGSSLGKRRRDAKLEKEEDYLNRPEIKLDIPDTLKGQLVDDWENVTKNQQLVTIPRTVNVNEVLSRYKRFKSEKKGSRELNEDLLEEVLEGLRIYFNKALGSMLLYRFERHQYAAIRKDYDESKLVELYGAEHLLRLFVQMPSLVAHTNMDPDAVSILTEYLTDILRFMQKHQKQLFLAEYENAAPGYVALSTTT